MFRIAITYFSKYSKHSKVSLFTKRIQPGVFASMEPPQQKQIEINQDIKQDLREIVFDGQRKAQIQSLMNGLQVYGRVQDLDDLEDGRESFVRYCQALDQKFQKSYYLSLEQTKLLKNLLLRILSQEDIDAELTHFPNLLKIFTFNFLEAFRNQQIKLEDTVESLENFIEYYVIFISRGHLTAYLPSYSFITKNLQQIIQKKSLKELYLINPKIFITLVQQIFRRYQFLRTQFQLSSRIFQILQMHLKRPQLSQLSRLKIFLLTNTSGIRLRYPYFQEYEMNPKIFRSLSKQSLIYYIKKIQTYTNSKMQLLFQACNQFVSSSQRPQYNLKSYETFFEGILAMAHNQQSSQILQPQNKSKMTEYLVNFIDIVGDRNEPIFKLFLKIFHTKMIDTEIAKKMLPFVIKNTKLNNSVQLIYQFARRGVFHEVFFQNIPGQVRNNFMDPDLESQQKVFDIKLACIYSMYQNNMEKISNRSPIFYIAHKQKLATLQKNKTKIILKISQLGSFPKFAKFISNISKYQIQLAQLHKNYKQKYFPDLFPQLNQENILTYALYLLQVCKFNEMRIQIQKISEYVRRSFLTQLKKKILGIRYSQRILNNFIIVLSSFLQQFKNLKNRSYLYIIHQILTIFTNPKTIQSIPHYLIPQFIKILKKTSQNLLKKQRLQCQPKLSSYFHLLICRQYPNLIDHPDYIQFVRYLIQEKVDCSKTHRFVQKLFQFGLGNNLVGEKYFQQWMLANFKVSVMEGCNIFAIMKSNYYDSNPLQISSEMIKTIIPVLRHNKITHTMLQQHQKQLLNAISICGIQTVLKGIIFFQIPPMPKNYELVYLTALISRATLLLSNQFKSAMSTALNCLNKLINDEAYCINPLKYDNIDIPQQQNLKQEFFNKMKLFLSKVLQICLSKRFNKILLTQINFPTHYSILNLCYYFDVVSTQYLKSLLDYCNQNDIPSAIYPQIFMKITRLLLVNEAKYMEKVEKVILDQQFCNKYLVQLIGSAYLTKNPLKFIQKILATEPLINSVILQYLETTHLTNDTIIKSLKKSNQITTQLKNDSPSLDKLKELVEKYIKLNGGLMSVLKIGKTLSFVLRKDLKKDQSFLYSILWVNQKKVSVSFLFYLKRILGKIFDISHENIYLCSEWQAEKLFGTIKQSSSSSTKSPSTETTLTQFQATCKSQPLSQK